MKPAPEQVREWDIASIAYADETTNQYPCWEDARNMGFAELAAQWGAEQAQHEAENAPWLTTAHMICTDAGIAHGPISGRLEALRDKLAEQAQQTTEPLGFQIRRAIAAEDELRATKQTLEHAYAALQKVADAQAAIEEPELPEAALYRCEACRKTGLIIHCSDPINCGGMVSYFTATQMHDHYQAGVRAGMGQSQDAKRLDWVESQGNGSGWLARNSITNRGYRIHNDKDAKHKTVREAIDSAMQGGQK